VRGFSFVELLTVLIVLAVLAALAAPSVSLWLEDYRVRAASRQLMSDLELARMMAVTQNTQYGIFFNQAGNQYWMQSQNPVTLVWSQAGYARQISVVGNPAYEPGVILSFTAQGNQTIAFSPTGVAPNGITAMLGSTNYQRNVIVATTGRVTIAQVRQP
jgi:type IV fimbrial biogenesis protein FimT